MKNFYLLLVALVYTVTLHSQKDHIISIANQELEVELDKEYSVEIDGKEITFSLRAKDTLTYQDEMFSFNYPKEYKISRTNLGDGVTQFVIINGEGSGFMIQKFTNMSPEMLNEMMLNELTKESVNYGFALERKDYSKVLKSGNEVHIDKAILNYKDDTNIYEVMTVGKKDEGILVVTMAMDAEMSSASKKLITMMWDSLEYK